MLQADRVMATYPVPAKVLVLSALSMTCLRIVFRLQRFSLFFVFFNNPYQSKIIIRYPALCFRPHSLAAGRQYGLSSL